MLSLKLVSLFYKEDHLSIEEISNITNLFYNQIEPEINKLYDNCILDKYYLDRNNHYNTSYKLSRSHREWASRVYKFVLDNEKYFNDLSFLLI